jgi:hypothetical protein
MTPRSHPSVAAAQSEDASQIHAAVDSPPSVPPRMDIPDHDPSTSSPALVGSAGDSATASLWQDELGAWARRSLGLPPAPVRWPEVIAVLLVVVLSDLTLYRGQGYAGCAVLFLVAPVLLLVGSPRPRLSAGLWIVIAMLLALAARMIWFGTVLGAAAGFALLIVSAMAIAGRRLYVLDVVPFALQTVVAGATGLAHYAGSAGQLSPKIVRIHWLSIFLPLAALATFGTMFILANPDLATSFGDMIDRAFRAMVDWIERTSLSGMEVLFWLATAWVTIGLLRPVLRRSVLARFSAEDRPKGEPSSPAESPLYPALRNTLVTLIALFIVYLAFEFRTLWFREFPKGFYYAGYAHEGAAWLTASLALASAVLSLIFRGGVLRDPRLPKLRRLAWIWSAENLLLAATVYNRLHIYVVFNGMTRMRTVALFGVTAVVAGVILVVWKILYNHDFVWLVRRHLAALAVVVYLFALTPVDALVHTYNVHRILAGDLAPSVQISVHPINAEGLLVLPPLLESDNEIIREGIRAMLAERYIEFARAAQEHERQGWTAFQIAERLLIARLHAMADDWSEYLDPPKRAAVLKRFHQYVYQWY